MAGNPASIEPVLNVNSNQRMIRMKKCVMCDGSGQVGAGNRIITCPACEGIGAV